MVLEKCSGYFYFYFNSLSFLPSSAHKNIFNYYKIYNYSSLAIGKRDNIKVNEISRTYINFSIFKSNIKGLNVRTIIKRRKYIVGVINQFTRRNHVQTLIIKVNRYDLEHKDNKLVVIDRTSLFTFLHLAH